jgi:hypothetical protein
MDCLKAIKGNEITEIDEDAESFGTELSGDSVAFSEGPRPEIRFQAPQVKMKEGSTTAENKTEDAKNLDRQLRHQRTRVTKRKARR